MGTQPNGRLNGRVALITGAARGIGAGIARRFVAEGARVTIGDVTDAHALADDLGPSAMAVHLDVTSQEDWTAAIAATEAKLGPLNILVNNAGIGSGAYIESCDFAEYERVVRINLDGTLYGMKLALPSLRRGGHGSIINMSSIAGLEGDAGMLPYVSSKWSMRGVTKDAAIEFGRDGIRANTIHPGLIRSGPRTDSLPDNFLGRIPLRQPRRADRAGTVDEIAGIAVFLASDAAAYVTGAEFVIDGGKSVRFPSVAADYTEMLASMMREKK